MLFSFLKGDAGLIVDETAMRRTIAKNIASYRKAHKITQTGLAEKLNYSDKAVSKWERGESLPDVTVLARIADLYGLTVSELIGETKPPRRAKPYYHLLIYCLAVAIVYVVATILCVAFSIADVPDFVPGMFFVYAIPVAAGISVVFTSLWWGIWQQTAAITALIWSGGLCLVLSLQLNHIALVFIVCGAMQVLTLLWELFRYLHGRKD